MHRSPTGLRALAAALPILACCSDTGGIVDGVRRDLPAPTDGPRAEGQPPADGLLVDQGPPKLDKTGPAPDTKPAPVITPDPPPASQLTFLVHSQQKVQPISRFIYGLNGASFSSRPKNLTLTRSGGNRLTAYNWENNASNAGTDWYNQNDDLLGSSNTPGEAMRLVVEGAIQAGAASIITVPILGYVAADKNGGGDVNQTPNYLQVRFKQSLPKKGSSFTLTPSTSDAYVYQDELVYFLDNKFPAAKTDPHKTIFYMLDNEPDLWATTHPRIRGAATGSNGTPVTYAELMQKTKDYAAAIKAVVPQAQVFGPASYGWNGFVNLQNATDAAGRDFIEFYLKELKAAEAAAGKRLVDVLDLHWYPEAQGGSVRITEANNTAAVAAARIQAPRSLWDTTYKEESWITQWSTNGPIFLIPRLKQKIDASYPGTKLSFSEYWYGGGDHISGAIAQADVLGIFGREGVYAATLWRMGQTHDFVWGGFDMYRNFDGTNGSFGDTSISATTSDAAGASVYASLDAGKPERVVLVCINKTSAAATAGLSITHTVQLTKAKVYQLTAGGSQPKAAPDISLTLKNALQYTMPASSVTTLVLLK